ncbi:MAG: 50S ribosomal protein L35 [Planctomycetes bacterium]|nr:50S ribosomal protein L35 [Planctomycetota bacterium]
MPKLKTNKAAKKRFKVTATGKVLFRPAGKKHLMSGKAAKRRRKMRRWRSFDGRHDAKDILVLVGR